MKVVLSIMQYDYGVEQRGYSFEYYNLYLPLCNVLGIDNVILFDFYSAFKQLGKAGMNTKIKELIETELPDVAIFALFENEFDEKIISSLKEITTTIVYFFDDPWRINFSKHWRKYFSFFTTPDYYTYQKYLTEGIKTVIYSPFGFNPNIYQKLNLPYKYDVSFVGGYSPLREWIVKKIRKAGINVAVFGRGWNADNKWVSQEEIVRIFNQSKINLNLSNAVSFHSPFLFWCLWHPKTYKPLILLRKTKEQVKGRHYEINACGGFQLSYFVPGLNLIYEIDKEIVCFENVEQLINEIKFFLQADSLREEIALNGYLKSHNFHKADFYIKNMLEIAVKHKNK